MTPDPQAVPIGRLFNHTRGPAFLALWALLRAADVVVAVDGRGDTTVFHGKPTLEKIIRTGRPQRLGVFRVELATAADREKLKTLVKILKGRCED
jgi:hypothetical protein